MGACPSNPTRSCSVCAVAGEQGCHLAPRTHRAWKRNQPSPRTVSDAYVSNGLLETVGQPEGLYGRRKMTVHLNRTGIEVSSGTVHRLMRLVLLLRRLLLIGGYQMCQVRRSRPAEARGCRCLSRRLRQEHPLSTRRQVRICAVSQPLRTSL